jgi:hypothetical protein
MQQELPIIQKTYDLVKWYHPILSRLPRDHRFGLGSRISTELYDVLESLVRVRYQREKLASLHSINSKLDVLRYQTRLLHDFELMSIKRYQYAGQQINTIGSELGGWINQQKQVKRY